MQNSPNSRTLTRKCLSSGLAHCSCLKGTKAPSKQGSHLNHVEEILRTGAESQQYAWKYFTKAENMPEETESEQRERSKLCKIVKLFRMPCFSMPTFNINPSNLQSLLFDIVGIISFFIMATIMFWFAVSQCVWQFAHVLLRSKRKAQVVVLFLLLLLCAIIIYHTIKGVQSERAAHLPMKVSSVSPQSQSSCRNKKPTTKCCRLSMCQHKKCCHFNIRSCKKNEKLSHPNLPTIIKKNPSLCDLCAKKFKGSSYMLDDDEARKMYQRYKVYSTPMEMKTPPSLFSLVDFLLGLFNAMTR